MGDWDGHTYAAAAAAAKSLQHTKQITIENLLYRTGNNNTL